MTDRPAADAAKRLAAFVALAPTHDFYVALQQVFGPNAPSRLREDIETVLADLWAARDLAFRAAFADEEGAEVQWGIQYPEDQTVSWVGSEASARSLTHSTPEALRRRVVPPWKPVPAGSVPQEKP